MERKAWRLEKGKMTAGGRFSIVSSLSFLLSAILPIYYVNMPSQLPTVYCSEKENRGHPYVLLYVNGGQHPRHHVWCDYDESRGRRETCIFSLPEGKSHGWSSPVSLPVMMVG